jgi:hypothetical protein
MDGLHGELMIQLRVAANWAFPSSQWYN